MCRTKIRFASSSMKALDAPVLGLVAFFSEASSTAGHESAPGRGCTLVANHPREWERDKRDGTAQLYPDARKTLSRSMTSPRPTPRYRSRVGRRSECPRPQTLPNPGSVWAVEVGSWEAQEPRRE